ncbi:MAG: FAD-dependent oxidoreductase [Patescibacteria group bacterium]|nr:FAD-dependent oxidoreductase [Patescibacteria group bacterium]
MKEKKYDLVIIGGGPAGMTAGIYAGRQKLNILLITKNFGGQVSRKAVDIENYPGFKKISGINLIGKFEEHLRQENIDIKEGLVVRVEKNNNVFSVFTEGKNSFKCRAVIIASGADPRPLEIPGEKEFIGKGVSYCSLCDGPLFSGKTVAVVGGGNAGFESAIFLSNYVKKIYILEYKTEINADKTNQDIIRKTKKAEIITNISLKEIKGENFVNSIVCEDRKTKKEKILPVDGLFVEIGSQPATSFVKNLVEFNERDEIKVEFETFKTKTPGLFAVGDVNIGQYKQIVTACAEGCKAALSAYQYLRKN